jgi:hypothetical protein
MRFFTTTLLRCPRLLPLRATRPIAHLSTASKKKPQKKYIDKIVESSTTSEKKPRKPIEQIKVESDKVLNANFSRVKIDKIAPRLGLSPTCTTSPRDTRYFDVHQARLPNRTFAKIADDLNMAWGCYGSLSLDDAVVSRILSSVSPSFLLYYRLGS